MNDHVYWMLELDVHPGREDEFRALMADMVDATQRNEPDTLSYEWSTRADGRACHIYERYADSAAVITHLTTFGQRFAGRFSEVLTPTRFVVYGSPSAAAKDAMAGLDPVYMARAAGFSR